MNEKLDFWGKDCLITLHKDKLKIYLGKISAANLLSGLFGGIRTFKSMRDLIEPSLIISIKDIYRVEKIDNTIIINWRKYDENKNISTMIRSNFSLYEKDADRFYNAINEILRGKSWSEVYSKYKIKYGAASEIIEDKEKVVIFKYDDGVVSFINPEVYERMYRDKGYKAEIFIDDIFVMDLPSITKFVDISNIKLNEIFNVELKCCDFRGRYILKITLNDGTKYTFKFKDYGNALKVYQRINEFLGKIGKVEMKKRPLGKILVITLISAAITFIASCIMNLYRSAFPLSIFVAAITFVILWRLTGRT